MKIERLIKRCCKGERAAQKDLYNMFAGHMYRVCFRYVRNEMDTEEIMANGFVKVFQHIDRVEYRGDRSFEGWVKRIMVNEALMFLRKKNNFNLVSDDQAVLVDSGEVVDSNLLAEEIFNLVLQLPTGYRTVFNLYAIEGFSHKEIAEQLGVTESTSKSQLSKARAMLKRLLIENGMYHER